MESNINKNNSEIIPPAINVVQNKVQRLNCSSSSASQGEFSMTSSMAEKLVSMWKAGANFSPQFTSSEGAANAIKLREIQEKCSAFEKINSTLQKTLLTYEGQIFKLQTDLKKEESEKKQWMDKIITIWDYMKDITETMNYVTETLDDCKVHNTRLHHDYNNVILKLSADNESRKTQVEHLTRDQHLYDEVTQRFSECQSNLKQSNLAVEKYIKRVNELESNEKNLHFTIHQLEEHSNELCKSHKLEVQKFSKQIQQLTEEKIKLESEKLDVFRTLAGKEEDIKAAKQYIDDCKMNLMELQSQLAEKTSHCQRANEQVNTFQMKIEEKNTQISQLIHDFETAKTELSIKSIEITKLEDEKRKLDQELEKSKCGKTQNDEKYIQNEEDFKRQINILEKKNSDSCTQLQTLQKNYDILMSKSTNDILEINRLRDELSKSTIQVEQAQKEIQDIHKLISEITDEKNNLHIRYEEIKGKYDNEKQANQQNCNKHSVIIEELNSQLAQLQQFNAEYLQQKNSMEQQLHSSVDALEMSKELQVNLTNNLQRTEENLRIAERKIEQLERQYTSLNSEKNEIIKNLREKSTSAGEQDSNLIEKYHETNLNLKKNIGQLEGDLETAKKNFQQTKENFDNFKILHQNTLQKKQQDVQAAEMKAQIIEKKYQDFKKNETKRFDELKKNRDDTEIKYKALLKMEKEKYQELQKQLEESDKRAKEYEDKYKNIEVQGEQLTKQMSGMMNILQNPISPSPPTWKKPSVASKKVSIVVRSDEISAAESRRKSSTQRSPATLKKLKSPAKKQTPIRKAQTENPHPLSPDSCTMDIDDDDEDDDLGLKILLERLSGNFSRDKPLSQTTKTIENSPANNRKFFKSRTSQPK